MVPRFKPKKLVGRYRSRSEERVAEHLEALGVPYLYEPKEHKIKYEIVKVSTYLPDFVLPDSGIILEVKGYFSPADREKYKRIRKFDPFIDLRFVFDRATNRLSKTSKTTYAAWAEQHGFLWCEKVIPPEWYKEKANERASSKAASAKGPAASRKAVHLTDGSPDRSRHLSACRKRA